MPLRKARFTPLQARRSSGAPAQTLRRSSSWPIQRSRIFWPANGAARARRVVLASWDSLRVDRQLLQCFVELGRILVGGEGLVAGLAALAQRLGAAIGELLLVLVVMAAVTAEYLVSLARVAHVRPVGVPGNLHGRVVAVPPRFGHRP